MQIRTTRELLAAGHSHRRIAQLVASGDLIRVAHGHYSHRRGANEVEHHLLQILTVAPTLPADAVLGRESAAVLHGLPLPPGPVGLVQVIRPPRTAGGGRRNTSVRFHRAALPPEQYSTMALESTVLRLTTQARTVAELGLRSLPWGVAAGDVALRNGMTITELDETVSSLGTRAGIARARQLAGHLDAAAESPAESLSRVAIRQAGLPDPQLQVLVGDDRQPLARLDFGWTRYRVAGECDGLTKYLDPSTGSPRQALRQEKQRESQVTDLGWLMVRWTYPEIFNGRMIRRLAAALVSRGWDGRSVL